VLHAFLAASLRRLGQTADWIINAGRIREKRGEERERRETEREGHE
jgi:hypothetical protein